MTFCDMLAKVSMRHCFKLLTVHVWYRGQVFVQCTHAPASIHKFCSQPDCLVDIDVEK